MKGAIVKDMKKIIATLLLVCILIPFAVACGEKTPAASTDPITDAPTATDAPVTEAPVVTEYPDIPEGLDYDSYDFVILSCLGNSIVFNF